MAEKTPGVFVGNVRASTTSKLFQTFFDIVEQEDVRIDLSYGDVVYSFKNRIWYPTGGEYADHLYRGWHTLEDGALKLPGIELESLSGIKKPKNPTEFLLSVHQLSRIEDLITNADGVTLLKPGDVACVVHERDHNGERFIADRLDSYNGLFEGLNPEYGEIKDPRPWLERIVQAFK